MLARRLRRRPNIKTTLAQCLVGFFGYVQIILTSEVRSAIEVSHEMMSLLANQHAVCPRRGIFETNRAYHI